jgi:putative FmdB family regulatory protein
MPIYEYQCEKCEDVSEAIQKFSDEPLTECKECGGKLKKMISSGSFHLKGQGWAKDGYTGKKPKTKKVPDTVTD